MRIRSRAPHEKTNQGGVARALATIRQIQMPAAVCATIKGRTLS